MLQGCVSSQLKTYVNILTIIDFGRIRIRLILSATQPSGATVLTGFLRRFVVIAIPVSELIKFRKKKFYMFEFSKLKLFKFVNLLALTIGYGLFSD